ncbi:MAG: DNA polymerase III subunit alpha [Phycisphaera sp. RhM]|nr:DNA polymerase III subunit alpha [Phycisphaera sp. RhM]
MSDNASNESIVTPAKPFVHLHCHSHYSLLDGAGDIKRLVNRAVDHGMNALALTDHGNLHGALEFYRAAKGAGINPIIGYEAYIAPGSRFDKGGAGRSKDASYHLTLLAKNRTGFKNLIKLASAASLEGFYFKPRIDKEILQTFNEGIICLSGCVSSEFSRTVMKASDTGEHEKEAMEIAGWFHKVFGDRYFIEVMNNGLDIQRMQLEGAVDIANKMGLPVVTTSDCHYVNQEDAEAQDIMLCINTGRFRTDTSRMKMENDQFFLRSPEQMYEHFPGMEDCVARSQEIADSVDIDIELGKYYFPKFECPNEMKPIDYLRELCIKGLLERYEGDDERIVDGKLSDEVMARLDRELGVIEKLNYPTYFLIVWDFVIHARNKGISATARGSGVGAIVCYALYMSHVCPLRYDLLFERFLDESRTEPPDIDIDFEKERRVEVIEYVKERYGSENVCQIGTFGTLAARAAIKDTGRALGIPLSRVNQITEMVPDELKITIKKALEKSADLKQTYDGDPEIRELLDLAMKIEGLARNVGTHAAAVVIADKPLSEYVPLTRVPGKQDVITQWSMNDVEASGLLKMDFLGLRNLTMLSRSVKFIKQTTGKDVDPLKFPLDDKATYALLQRGETKGVFQLESGGIRDLLTRMKPDCFHDIIATAALYRPGPLEGGMVDDYVNIKHGRQSPEYKHPVLKEILEETNSIMVYQEQVMRILNRLGGVPLAKAYTCIKAISKKKEALINQNQEVFLKGAVESGLAQKDAEDIWNLIVKFAGYGFNKCVVGETEVIDAVTGESTTVEELFQSKREFTIHALNDRQKLVPRKVTDVVWNGVRQTFTVTTRTGRQITATGNHPMKTFDGWTNIDDLNVGDKIAVARTIEPMQTVQWSDHEVITLGWLIAEGNLCHPTCLYFYSNSQSQVDDFVYHSEQFDETSARSDYRSDGRIEVCLSTGRDTRLGSLDHAGVGTAVAAKRITGLRCGAYAWVQSLGLTGKKATEKHLPEAVFQLDQRQTALLLGRLWAGDGYVEQPSQQSYYATSSLQLAHDVQRLLQRLGIVSRVTEKSFAYAGRADGKPRNGYTVHLIGHESRLKFLHTVGPQIVDKQAAVMSALDRIDAGEAKTTGDLVPVAVRSLVAEERVRREIPWRELESQSGVSIREFCRTGQSSKRGFQRSTVQRLADFFDSESLADHAQSDLFWDDIVSIEPADVVDVYDLTVENDHNFVANGLVVHNSHSTAYALVAFQTAYLKAHYPVEFMASLLSSDIDGRNFKRKDALVEHMEDCDRMGIEVVPPSVNTSEADFSVADGKIHFALSAIKACGGSTAISIEQERKKNGPFKDIFDFCERVDPHACNKSAIETLVKAGAMDCFGAKRSQLVAVIEKAMQAGAAVQADKKSGQASLFGAFEEEEEAAGGAPAVVLPEMDEWPDREKLGYEKEVLGYYLDSHPLAEYEPKLATFRTHTTDSLSEIQDRGEVILGGMISSIKIAHTKNPKPGQPSKYANFDLEDMQGAIRCILWPRGFADHGEKVIPDAVVLAKGKVDRRGGGDEANLIIDELIPLDDLDNRYTHGMRIRLDEAKHDGQTISRLREIVRGYPGNQELLFSMKLAEGELVHLKADKFKVQVTPEMRSRIDDLLGSGNYRLMMSKPR